MGLRLVDILVATALLLSAPAFAEETRTIYIEVAGQAEFEVIYHRALSNAFGAAIGGIIGAGIQSGVEASKDTGKADQLRPLIQTDTWRDRFLDTLNDELEADGFEAVWIDQAQDAGKGFLLKIYPESYGYRMVDTTTQMVSAYIAFKASFSGGSTKNSNAGEREAYYITGKSRYPFDKLLEENSPVSADLEAVLEKAANRLANKIVYSLKE